VKIEAPQIKKMVATTFSLGDHSVMEGDRFSPWRAMDGRWKRNVVSLVSSVIVVMRLPIYCQFLTAFLGKLGRTAST